MIFGVKKATAWLGHAVGRLVHPGRHWLDIDVLNIGLRDFPAAFDGYRIALFSDLHFDGVSTTSARLRELVDAINGQQPDLIAFTGDFISYQMPYNEQDLIEALRDMQARDGKVAVMGNHDGRQNSDPIRHVIRESGMIDLDNAVYSIQRGETQLHIAGVDSMIRHRARLDLVMQQLPPTGSAILLAHEPAFADVSAATGRFALQLSGHVHGGQIRIPGLTPLLLRGVDPRFLRRAALIGTLPLYINRGIGMTGLLLRFRCHSELTIMTLKKIG